MIVTRCTQRGCRVLTIGERCVEHDLPVTRTFARGRPFPAVSAASESDVQVATRSVPLTQSVGTRRGALRFVRLS